MKPRKPRIERICQNPECKKVFETIPSVKGKFCSSTCYRRTKTPTDVHVICEKCTAIIGIDEAISVGTKFFRGVDLKLYLCGDCDKHHKYEKVAD